MWKRGTTYGFWTRGLRVGLALALSCAFLPNHALSASKRPYLQLVKDVSAPDGFSGVCGRYSWACARSGTASPKGQELLALADRVNLAINRRVREVSDQAQYNRKEYWALPTARGGDCEDFALAKKQALIAQGVAPEQLLIATVLDRKKNPHAVLVLRTDAGDVILDNLTNRIVGWNQTGYTFLRMQNPAAPNRWSALLTGGILGG